MLQNRHELIIFSLKLLLAWAAMTGLIVFAGEWLLTPLFPLFKEVMRMIVPEISPSLAFIHTQGGDSLELKAWVLHAMPIDAGVMIPKGIVLPSSTHVLHVLVPLAIELSILLVWPVRSWRQKFLLVGVGTLTIVMILAATIPALLLALIEMPYQELALERNAGHQAPWLMDWMVFCEMGGSLLLALIGTIFSIRLQRRFTK